MLFDQSDIRNICTDCCGQSERQPPLTLQAMAAHTGLSQMVSYLIVRLEMQYFHMAFHTAVTSPEASDMPEKNAHGTERKFPKKVVKTQNCSDPLPRPQKKKSGLCSLPPEPQITPHILHFPQKTHREIHSFAAKVTLCHFEALPVPLVYVGLRVAALADCLMTK